MYVSCVTFSFYLDPDTGVFSIIWYLINSDSHPPINPLFSHDYILDMHSKSTGKRFQTFKEWNEKRYQRIVEDMMGYAKYVNAERTSAESVPVVPALITFDTGLGMLPMLSPATKGARGVEIAKQAQDIVQAYFN